MIKISITISKLEFKNNLSSSLNCLPNDIVVFAGANNCGKTACLKEIMNFTANQQGTFESRFFEKLEFYTPGSTEDFKTFITSYGTKVNSTKNNYNFNGINVDLDYYANTLWNGEHMSYQIGQLFIHNLNTEERLGLASRNNNKADYDKQPPFSPLQKIEYDSNLEKSVSKIFAKLFFKDLIVDHLSGSTIVLRVGKRPNHTKENDRLSNEYRDNLKKLPKLEEQGDGIKSATGIILELWTSPLRTILVLDEPEAFLHPPQAKELGKIIANDRPNGQQLFIATHSSDFVKGLMEANNSNVHIIRLDRNRKNDSITIKTLQNSDLKDLLKNSWLKYSNALDSIFYQETILCEADADSRFYNAILDSCDWEDKDFKPETFFLPCGGIPRLRKATKHLISLGVKPKIIADIDIIFNNDTKILFEELGGKYSEIEKEHNELKGFTGEKDKVKRNGKLEFGTLQNKFEFVTQKCSELGFFILHIGELESWHKGISGKSDIWLSNLFDQIQDLKAAEELKEAREFVSNIFKYNTNQNH